MNISDVVLCIIELSGGRVQGRTLLQKRAYFTAVLSNTTSEMGFDAHYYGPYSAPVDNAITKLKSMGFVDEVTVGFGVVKGGFEMKRYDYRLTDDGNEILREIKSNEQSEYRRIAENYRRIVDAGSPDYFELSIAAKTFFIVRKLGKTLSRDELVREAKRFNWDIAPESLDKAVSFLERLGLTGAGATA